MRVEIDYLGGAGGCRNRQRSLLEAPTSRFLLLATRRRIGTVDGGRSAPDLFLSVDRPWALIEYRGFVAASDIFSHGWLQDSLVTMLALAQSLMEGRGTSNCVCTAALIDNDTVLSAVGEIEPQMKEPRGGRIRPWGRRRKYREFS